MPRKGVRPAAGAAWIRRCHPAAARSEEGAPRCKKKNARDWRSHLSRAAQVPTRHERALMASGGRYKRAVGAAGAMFAPRRARCLPPARKRAF